MDMSKSVESRSKSVERDQRVNHRTALGRSVWGTVCVYIVCVLVGRAPAGSSACLPTGWSRCLGRLYKGLPGSLRRPPAPCCPPRVRWRA